MPHHCSHGLLCDRDCWYQYKREDQNPKMLNHNAIEKRLLLRWRQRINKITRTIISNTDQNEIFQSLKWIISYEADLKRSSKLRPARSRMKYPGPSQNVSKRPRR